MSTDLKNATRIAIKLKEPQLYKVILLNDDYTPMDFVAGLLIDLFHKSLPEAQCITLDIHENGRGVAGIYTKEIAEQKVIDVALVAGHYSHPLISTIEPN